MRIVTHKQDSSIEKNVVIIGSGGCGKTCILHRIVTNSFSDQYIPTVFEDSVWSTYVKGKEIVLLLKDTAGQEDYDRLISLAVSGADIIILCYAIDDRRSFEDIRNKYIHIIPQADFARAKLALVGSKKDLRTGASGGFVTREEGEMLKTDIDARWFFESSAKSNEGIREMFDEFARWSYEESSPGREKGFLKSILYYLKCSCCRVNADSDSEDG
jgi:small GTP-binding protein